MKGTPPPHTLSPQGKKKPLNPGENVVSFLKGVKPPIGSFEKNIFVYSLPAWSPHFSYFLAFFWTSLEQFQNCCLLIAVESIHV